MPVGLDYFKTFLGIPQNNTTQDDKLQLYLDASWAGMLSEIGRDIDQATYPSAPMIGRGDSGFYSGNGSRTLRLRQRPAIASGMQIWLDNSGRFGENPDGSFATATLLVYGTDYVLKMDGNLPGTQTQCSYAGILERVATVWPGSLQYTPGQVCLQPIPQQGNIKVIYTAGWPIVPYDLRLACCQIAAGIRRTAKVGGPITSESQGGYSYSLAGALAAGQIPEMGTIRQVLAKYKETIFI